MLCCRLNRSGSVQCLQRCNAGCMGCSGATCVALRGATWCAQVTGAVGWRKDSIKYKKNEVFLDIVEQVSPSPPHLA